MYTMVYDTRYFPMKKEYWLLLAMLLVSALGLRGQGCSDLFFSEYVEGSSNNKCLEIYNPTGSAINLSTGAYKILMYFNGATTVGLTINLTGTVGAYDVYVVCQSSASATLLAQADQTNGAGWYNGDDAIALVKGAGNTPVDIIGQIGFDPGTEWGSGSITTLDHTLRRKATVSFGDTNGGDAFTPVTEWDGFANDSFGDVGTYTNNCVPATPCSITEIGYEIGECDNNDTPNNPSDDFVDIAVCAFYSNKPATGNLVFTGDVSFSIPVSEISSGGYCAYGLTIPADGTTINVTAYFSADPACTLTDNSETAPGPCSVVPPCSNPFISEYTEGLSNNKCIEIYNPTAGTIDLAAGGYQLLFYFNGSTSAGTTINLAGSIPSGGTWVVCDDNASANILAAINQLSTANFFNGDDAIELRNNTGTLDVFGQIGVDPGTAWTNLGVSSMDHTLRRFLFVQQGDTNGSDPFDVSAQWYQYPADNTDNLGYHASTCVTPPLPYGMTLIKRNCPGGTGSYNAGTNVFTLSSNCFNPDLRFDDITYAFKEMCGDIDMSVEVSTLAGLGFAGLMIREDANLGSKYVWINLRANGQSSWVTRSTTNGVIQINQTAPQFGRKWVRIKRTGSLFQGFVSTNGTVWQLLFQSSIQFNQCYLAGMAVYSNVDGATTTASFRNFICYGSEGLAEADKGTEDYIESPLTTTGKTFEDLTLMPNPAGDFIDVVFNQTETSEPTFVTILDLNGRKLFTQQVDTTSEIFRIDLASLGLSEGLYLLSAQTGNKIATKRFVKVAH